MFANLRGDEQLDARVDWIAGSAAVRGSQAAGLQLVRIRLADGDVLYRVVRVGGEIAPEVRLGHAVSVSGRVVGPQGEPVAGAAVWVGGRTGETGRDGVFEIAGVRGASGLPLVLRADGYAHRFRIVEAGVAGQPPPTYHLLAGSDVALRLRGLPPDGGCRVFVAPAPGDEGELALRHFPFFWPEIEELAVLDAQGDGVLRGLPAIGALEIGAAPSPGGAAPPRHPGLAAARRPAAWRPGVRRVAAGWWCAGRRATPMARRLWAR